MMRNRIAQLVLRGLGSGLAFIIIIVLFTRAWSWKYVAAGIIFAIFMTVLMLWSDVEAGVSLHHDR